MWSAPSVPSSYTMGVMRTGALTCSDQAAEERLVPIIFTRKKMHLIALVSIRRAQCWKHLSCLDHLPPAKLRTPLLERATLLYR